MNQDTEASHQLQMRNGSMRPAQGPTVQTLRLRLSSECSIIRFATVDFTPGPKDEYVMPTYHGSCHCGAIQFVVEGEIAETYTCDCSLCSKKNALMANVHESRLTITAGEDGLALYQWNALIAKHYFCAFCGIYPFHKKRSMPDHYGVNVKCLDDFEWNAVPVRPAEGKGMPIVDPNAREIWPGPRQT